MSSTGNVNTPFAFHVDDVVLAATDALDLPLRFRHLRVIPELAMYKRERA